MNLSVYLFGSLIVFFLTGMPIAFAVGLAVAFTILVWGEVPLIMNFQQMYQGIDSFTLIALPMFVWAGDLMGKGGIIDDLLVLCRVLCGRVRGSLAHANIVGSMFFAGISGSATSDTAAIGGALIPAMVQEGYDPDFSVAVTASSSVIGPIIPPSMGMVLFGSVASVSVSALFIGGILPGILLGVSLMLVAAYFSHKRNYPKNTRKYTAKEITTSVAKGLPSIVLMAIILGGILGGIFTPTEASSIAVVYALLIGTFYYKCLNGKIILKSLCDSMAMAGSVLVIVAVSYPLGWLVAMGQVPVMVSDFILSVTSNKYVVLMMMNVFLLFLGCIMDANANLLIFAPILVPIANQFGINPVHFGVMFVLNVIIGLATPPFGTCLFIASGIAKISMERTMKAILPFCLAEIAVLMIVTYFEPVVTFLPRLFGLM